MKIPNPCTQNYNNMLPAEGGRFCGICNTVVVDFTKMNSAEIVTWFEARPNQHVCGRYSGGQVETNSTFNNWMYRQKERIERLTPGSKVKLVLLIATSWLFSLSSCMGARAPQPKDFESHSTTDSTAHHTNQGRPATHQK